jgi:hypothetical protein
VVFFLEKQNNGTLWGNFDCLSLFPVVPESGAVCCRCGQFPGEPQHLLIGLDQSDVHEAQLGRLSDLLRP